MFHIHIYILFYTRLCMNLHNSYKMKNLILPPLQ